MKKLLFSILFTLLTTITFYSQKTGEIELFEAPEILQRKALEKEILDISNNVRKLKDSIIMIELSGNPKNSSQTISEQDSITLKNNIYFTSKINEIFPILKTKCKSYLNIYWSISDQDLLTVDNEVNSDNIILYALSSIEFLKKHPNYLDPLDFPSLKLEQILLNGNYQLISSSSSLSKEVKELTWSEVAFCAAAAIGVDFMWGVAGLSGNQGVKWGKKAILKAFGKIASRMLGPIGTALAIGSFGYCIASEYQD